MKAAADVVEKVDAKAADANLVAVERVVVAKAADAKRVEEVTPSLEEGLDQTKIRYKGPVTSCEPGLLIKKCLRLFNFSSYFCKVFFFFINLFTRGVLNYYTYTSCCEPPYFFRLG